MKCAVTRNSSGHHFLLRARTVLFYSYPLSFKYLLVSNRSKVKPLYRCLRSGRPHKAQPLCTYSQDVLGASPPVFPSSKCEVSYIKDDTRRFLSGVNHSHLLNGFSQLLTMLSKKRYVKVLMLQYCVSVKDKEISSSKATVSCSLLETSLNHQPIVMVFLTTLVTRFMKAISVVNRRNEHSLIIHNSYIYMFTETTSYCQGKSRQKSQSFWYPRKPNI